MPRIRHAWLWRRHYLYYRLQAAVSSYIPVNNLFSDECLKAGRPLELRQKCTFQTRGNQGTTLVTNPGKAAQHAPAPGAPFLGTMLGHCEESGTALTPDADAQGAGESVFGIGSSVHQPSSKDFCDMIPDASKKQSYRSYCSQEANGSGGEDESSMEAGNESGDEDDSEQPFRIEVGDWNKLDQKIQSELVIMESKVCNFENRYNKYVRPKLSSSCLIAPYDLKHQSTVFLYRQTFEIMNRYPSFLSSYDVMCYEGGVKNQTEWDDFIRHISKKRVYIIEDWNSCFSTVEALMYDHGIVEPRDGSDHNFCKGELDASFDADTKTATLSFIIWKGDRIIHSEVYTGVKCESANEAEIYAAFALLSKAKDLKIEKLLVWSDCKTVCEILSGVLAIEMKHEHRNLYLMLRSMKRFFTKLIAVWKPRELMVFADELSKASDIDIGSNVFPTELYERWSEHLRGGILFRIERTKETTKRTNKFGDVVIDEAYGENEGCIFFVEVTDELKLDCLLHLKQALEPKRLDVSFNNFDGKSEDFKMAFEQVIDGLSLKSGVGQYNTFTDNACRVDEKHLLVVYDYSVPKSAFYHKGAFHVIFVTPEERINLCGIPELNALHFVYFNGVTFPLNPKKKGDGAENDGQKGGDNSVGTLSGSQKRGDGDEENDGEKGGDNNVGTVSGSQRTVSGSHKKGDNNDGDEGGDNSLWKVGISENSVGTLSRSQKRGDGDEENDGEQEGDNNVRTVSGSQKTVSGSQKMGDNNDRDERGDNSLGKVGIMKKVLRVMVGLQSSRLFLI